MSRASARRKPNEQPALLDTELEHLPPELRWREWMGRVEAVIFAASEPVPREVLALVVGKSCNLELVIDDIRAELAGRPYELTSPSSVPSGPSGACLRASLTTKNLSRFAARRLFDRLQQLGRAGALGPHQLPAVWALAMSQASARRNPNDQPACRLPTHGVWLVPNFMQWGSEMLAFLAGFWPFRGLGSI
ncbi:MAG: DUF1403 family protein [Mesorhizobium sp.]|nr:MAG: DUF1403 family protein [Mesorhizobium sp.]